MAKKFTVTAALQNLYANGIADAVEDGSTNPKPQLLIYDGAQPAGPGTAITTQNLLATIDLDADTFGAAVSGVITALGVPLSGTATGTGTASWYRVLDRDDVAVCDGSVGTADADLELDVVSITALDVININSWTVTVPAVLA